MVQPILLLVISITISIILCIVWHILFYNPTYNPNIRIVSKDPNHKPTKLLVVAHPDDEILWAYNYLKDDPKSWKVICITCARNKTRVQEFETVMKQLGIKNYEMWDHDNSIFARKFNSLALDDIKKDILQNGYQLILTHNGHGEYGNLQHISLHNSLKKLEDEYDLPIKYFESGNFKNGSQGDIDKDKLLNNYKSQGLIIKCLTPLHSFY